jgi:hypothetical protein
MSCLLTFILCSFFYFRSNWNNYVIVKIVVSALILLHGPAILQKLIIAFFFGGGGGGGGPQDQFLEFRSVGGTMLSNRAIDSLPV